MACPQVRTVQDADRVPERINDRRCCESAPALGDGYCCRSWGWGHEGAIHNSYFVLVRTDAELGVGARAGVRTAGIRSDAQKVLVSARDDFDVVGGKNHGGETLQDSHGMPFRRRESRSTLSWGAVAAGVLSEVPQLIWLVCRRVGRERCRGCWGRQL